MSNTIRPGNLQYAVSKALRQYHDGINTDVVEISEQIAREGLKVIRKIGGYNDRTGRYRRGFYILRIGTRSVEPRYVLANKRYRLTHLLEHGHPTRGGSLIAKPHPHWEQTEKFMVDEYVRRTGEALNK